MIGSEHRSRVFRSFFCILTRVGRPTLSGRLSLWTCHNDESLPPPWLKQTGARCAFGKPTDHTRKQELDRCWSGTSLESLVSDFALSLQRQRQSFWVQCQLRHNWTHGGRRAQTDAQRLRTTELRRHTTIQNSFHQCFDLNTRRLRWGLPK